MIAICIVSLLFSMTQSIPIADRSSDLRFSAVEGGSCQGGEHRPFLTKNHPVPYTDSAPFELTLPDGTTESIPVQPATTRSTGTCEERSSCELSPTESNNGATGCESDEWRGRSSVEWNPTSLEWRGRCFSWKCETGCETG